MEFHDSETQRLLRTTARSYFATAFPPERLYGLHSGNERLTQDDVRALAELGWLTLVAPENAGGGGASLLDAAVVVEEAGYASAPTPIAIANVAARLAIQTKNGSLLRHPSLFTIADTARQRSNGYELPVETTNGVVTGSLRAVPFADLSAFVIAPLSFNGRSALAALPLRDAAIEPLVLLDRACYANVRFSNGPVGELVVLATGDDAVALQSTCDALMTGFAVVEMTGLMQRVLEMTVEHISTRQQFGQPIGKFQAARHRAAELLTQIETTRWAAYHALWRYEQDEDTSEIWLAKHWAARAADRVFQIAHLLHGGVGVGIEHPLHLYTQSIAAFAVRSGTMDEMVDRTLESLQITA